MVHWSFVEISASPGCSLCNSASSSALEDVEAASRAAVSASRTRDEVTSPDTDIHSSLQVNICSFNGLVCVCVTYSKVQGFKSKHPSVLVQGGKVAMSPLLGTHPRLRLGLSLDC